MLTFGWFLQMAARRRGYLPIAVLRTCRRNGHRMERVWRFFRIANPLHGDSAFRFKVVGAEDRKDLASDDKKEGRIGKDTTRANQNRPKNLDLLLNGGEASALTDISGGVKELKWSKDGKESHLFARIR